ncbi:MAG: class I SAM-dependent methyltransferase [Chloroflexi bacterium]|nr:class I SAM-dependent methyltransferase [Chloroflexota bacterium]
MFDFGANWQAFSEKRVNAERLDVAAQSLQKLLQRDALTGLSFLDVGCGSGLFSIAAYQLGAAKVVGLDINPRSIASSAYNRDRLTPQAPLEFVEMSVLDRDKLRTLGAFDFVYAWGSLHHTGAMWTAIENVLDAVRPGGTLVLAIYNRHGTSRVWQVIKRVYSRLPRWAQSIVAVPFGGVIYLAKLIVTRRNPLEKQRGMDFWYDVIDWLGGYPYEYATRQEIEAFVTARGFTLVRSVPAQVPTGCNEFVFERN